MFGDNTAHNIRPAAILAYRRLINTLGNECKARNDPNKKAESTYPGQCGRNEPAERQQVQDMTIQMGMTSTIFSLI
jgi:hypothetical protein